MASNLSPVLDFYGGDKMLAPSYKTVIWSEVRCYYGGGGGGGEISFKPQTPQTLVILQCKTPLNANDRS